MNLPNLVVLDAEFKIDVMDWEVCAQDVAGYLTISRAFDSGKVYVNGLQSIAAYYLPLQKAFLQYLAINDPAIRRARCSAMKQRLRDELTNLRAARACAKQGEKDRQERIQELKTCIQELENTN